ncbi:MAG: hypothetical protein Q8O14_00950 [bacterium]|nr:hypothetical protein [bacterium]
MTSRILIDHLRAMHGYTVLEAERAVRDVLDVLRYQLDELDADEFLSLPNLGRYTCRVKVWPDGSNGLVIDWKPCALLAQGKRARTLPANDPRVVLARDKRRPKRDWRAL